MVTLFLSGICAGLLLNRVIGVDKYSRHKEEEMGTELFIQLPLLLRGPRRQESAVRSRLLPCGNPSHFQQPKADRTTLQVRIAVVNDMRPSKSRALIAQLGISGLPLVTTDYQLCKQSEQT